MNRHEQLMVRAMEECNEIAQRLSKALIFGMDQVQHLPGDKPEENPELHTNHERVRLEFRDLAAVLDMIDPKLTAFSGIEFEAKQAKVERYLLLSEQCGTLDPPVGGADEGRE